MSALPDPGTVAAMLAERMAELARDLLGEPHHRGRLEWRYRGRDGGKDALAVAVAGPKRGSWHDHHASMGGGALGLVAHAHRDTTSAAYRWALEWLGIAGGGEARPAPQRPPALQTAPREACADDRGEKALRIWHEAADAIDGTPAELHLRRRGIDPALLPPHTGTTWPAALRWHAPSRALVLAVNDAHLGVVRSAQTIALHLDGSPRRRASGAKLKLSFGPISGRAARFGWHPDAQGRWGIAEGPITALAAAQLLGHPIWAALGSGNLPNVQPPPWARSATVVADHDEAGMRAAAEAACRLSERMPVRIIRATKPGADAADLLEAVA